ncbi:MAG: SHOCT domain-containing protein [Bacteroidota bacterium]
MKNFDPSSIMIFVAVMFLFGVDLPFIVFLFFVFMVVRSATQGKKNKRTDRRDYRRQDRQYDHQRRREADYRRQERRNTTRRPAQTAPKPRPKNNPFKKSGLAKYRDYDYEGAIEEFNKGLQINAQDVAIHFNLACAYSLTEQVDQSYEHLSLAVKYGFTDFEKIKTHDALAFLRIQDEFEAFVKQGYKWPMDGKTASSKNQIKENDDLLEQLNKLGELKERGLLTEEEFQLQKKRLLG